MDLEQINKIVEGAKEIRRAVALAHGTVNEETAAMLMAMMIYEGNEVNKPANREQAAKALSALFEGTMTDADRMARIYMILITALALFSRGFKEGWDDRNGDPEGVARALIMELALSASSSVSAISAIKTAVEVLNAD